MANAQRGQVGLEHLPDAILNGIKTARVAYHKMSGGPSEDYPRFWIEWPEYWVTVYVAQKLWKKYGDGNVTLESNSDGVLDRKRGQPKKETKNKKYDIVLWQKNGSARAMIEIKHQQDDKTLIIADLKRVVAALDADKKMQAGAIGYYYDEPEYNKSKKAFKTSRGKVVAYRNKLIESAQEKVKGTSFRIEHDEYIPHGTNDAWIAGCLVVKRK